MTTLPNRRKESAKIKRAVKTAIPGAIVKTVTGKGTSWGWWHIYLEAQKIQPCTCTYTEWGTRNTCENCKERWQTLACLAEKAVHDSGVELSYFYDDNDTHAYKKIACVNVNVELTGTVPLKRQEPTQ